MSHHRQDGAVAFYSLGADDFQDGRFVCRQCRPDIALFSGVGDAELQAQVRDHVGLSGKELF